jgi:hypothetical protein
MTKLKFNQNKNVCQANRKSTRIQIIFSQILFLHIKLVVSINILRLFLNAGHHLLFSWSPSSFTQAFWVYVVLCSRQDLEYFKVAIIPALSAHISIPPGGRASVHVCPFTYYYICTSTYYLLQGVRLFALLTHAKQFLFVFTQIHH